MMLKFDSEEVAENCEWYGERVGESSCLEPFGWFDISKKVGARTRKEGGYRYISLEEVESITADGHELTLHHIFSPVYVSIGTYSICPINLYTVQMPINPA